jgi:hypothetical protein
MDNGNLQPRLHVMFVDDSESDRKIFQNALTVMGHEIDFIGVETGYAARAYLKLYNFLIVLIPLHLRPTQMA